MAEPRQSRPIEPDVALAHVYRPIESSYDERDVALYALGVGAGGDPADLPFVYEGHPAFAPLPTFAVVPARNAAPGDANGFHEGGLDFGLDRALHTEHFLEIKRPFPTRGKLRNERRMKAVRDLGRHAAFVSEIRTFDEAGRELAVNEFTMTVRGAGGWSGRRAPAEGPREAPPRPPDAAVEQPVRADQALLYRLSGDRNPLHADPAFAQEAGLPGPILHGLCVLGFSVRHVLRAFAGDEPGRVRTVGVRFSGPVFPGETLATEMWKLSENEIAFRCRAKERDREVLSGGLVGLAPQSGGTP